MFVNVLAVSVLAVVSTVQAGANLPPIPKDKSTPVAQRLALQGPNAMAVAWNTYQSIKTPTVLYGTSPSALTSKASSSSSVTYPSSRTWANTVVLSGLSPATVYYYKIQSTNSSVDSFKTGRVAGDMTPFSALSVIDMGIYGADGYTLNSSELLIKDRIVPRIDPSLEHTTIGRLVDIASQYDFVLHPGDLAYADDWYEKPHNLLDGKNAYEAIIEGFYDQLSAVSRMKPYMVSPGNHEVDCTEIPNTSATCPQGQSNFSDFKNRFGTLYPPAPAFVTSPLPSSSSGNASVARQVAAAKTHRANAAALAQPPFWYSFEYGMAHFVMINTETDFANAPDAPGGSGGLNGGPEGAPGQQLKFLEEDLASVDRSVTPWVIVSGHRPWYTTSGPCGPCQSAFESLFYKYGVDLAIFGHVHNMQRQAPIYNGTVDPAGLQNPRAPWYLVSGAAGNIEGLTSVPSNKPAYNVFANGVDYGFSKLSFLSSTRLQAQFVRSTDGAILDDATLYKNHTTRFVGST